MFYIFESVILFFLKHSNFRVFFYVIHEEIMQIGKAKTSKDYVVLGKIKNEDSRGFTRLYEGSNYVPKVPRQFI